MTLSPEMNNPAPSGPQAYPQAPQAYPAAPQAYPQVPQPAGPKVSVRWTGWLMALGALAGAIAAFLPFEKIVVFRGGTAVATATLTGVGSKSATGMPINGIAAANGGKIVLAMSIVGLICALVIVAGKGRLWASIIGLIALAVGGILAVATFGAAHDDQKQLNALVPSGWSVHALTKLGADIASVGLGVAVLAAILAICVRRRRAS